MKDKFKGETKGRTNGYLNCNYEGCYLMPRHKLSPVWLKTHVTDHNSHWLFVVKEWADHRWISLSSHNWKVYIH